MFHMPQWPNGVELILPVARDWGSFIPPGEALPPSVVRTWGSGQPASGGRLCRKGLGILFLLHGY